MNIQEYINYIKEDSDKIQNLLNSLSPAQLGLRKEEGKWNVLEILEHIYLTEKVCIMLLHRPSQNHYQESERFGKNTLNKLIVEKRDRKIQAPDGLHPKGLIKDAAAFEKLFTEQRNALKEALKSGKIVIDNRIHKHPFLGEMTVTDWLHFVPAHTQRHIEQIKELIV